MSGTSPAKMIAECTCLNLYFEWLILTSCIRLKATLNNLKFKLSSRFVLNTKQASKVYTIGNVCGSARETSFTNRDSFDVTIEVSRAIIFSTHCSSPLQEYFKQTNRSLSYPNLFCVEIRSKTNKGIKFPIECCEVIPGQQLKRAIQDANLITDVLNFSKKRPEERLKMIIDAVAEVRFQTFRFGSFLLTLNFDRMGL